MNRERRQIRAFTLVELLVVVAIIAVLVALLLPSLNRARESAKATACASNLHQIALGFQMYRNDWNNFMGPLNSANSYNANGTAKSYGMWDCIGPYVGRKEWGGISGIPGTPKEFGSFWSTRPQPENFRKSVFACPQELNTIAWDKGYAESVYLQPVGYFSGNNPRPWSVPRKTPRYSPSTKVHVSESDDWHLGETASVIPANYTNPHADHAWDIYRHLEGCNVLFLDGHVSFYKATSIFKDLTRDPLNSKSIKNFCLP